MSKTDSPIILPNRPRFTSGYQKPSFSYVINENKTGVINGYPYKGVIVAKLYGGESMFAGVWNKQDRLSIFDLENIKLNFEDAKALSKKFHFDFDPSYRTFEGVAYCSIDDKWDMKRGMEEARRKAWTKYYHHLEKALNEFSDMTDQIAGQVKNYHNRVQECCCDLDMKKSTAEAEWELKSEIV